jgi:hypothetical protein
MKVLLNALTINDPDAPQAGIFLEQITGLGLPPLRTSSGNYAGRSGGYVGSQLYSSRPIGLRGRVFANDLTDFEVKRRELQEALSTGVIELSIITNAGQSYLVYCRLIDFDMPVERNLFQAAFRIELLAPDHLIYDNGAGASLEALLERQTSGGYVYPVVYPVAYAPGSSPTTVTNAGTVDVAPIITLTDIMTNPVLTNVTTGKTLGVNLTTSTGDELVIDMRERTVLLNGGSVFGSLADNSSFWMLLVGANLIKLTTSSGSDTVSGLLTYRPGYLGI